MTKDYYRTKELNRFFKSLVRESAYYQRWLPIVQELLKFTVVALVGGSFFICFAYYKDMINEEYIHKMELSASEELLPTDSPDFETVAWKVVGKPPFFSPPYHPGIVCAAGALHGVDAETLCVKKACDRMARCEARHGKVSYGVLEQFENTTNLFSTTANLNIGMKWIPPHVPIVPDYVMKLGFEAAARSELEALTERCGICLLKNPSFKRSDHTCACTQGFHYGCLRMYVHKIGTSQCPFCRTDMVVPINKYLDACKKTVITGGDFNNTKVAVGKMLRDSHKIPGDPRFFASAYSVLLRDLSLGSKMSKIACPDLRILDLLKVTVNYDSKSGPTFPDPYPDTGVFNDYAKNPCKGEARHAATLELYMDLLRIDKLYREQPEMEHDLFNYLDTIWYKISSKVEALQDLTKQRLFFLPVLRKFILDKIIMGPVVKRLYNLRYIMVGHRWHGGGAHKLFRYLKGKWPGVAEDHFYFEWDLSRQDQSVKPFHIIMNFMIFLTDYYGFDDGNAEDKHRFKMFRDLLAWSADNAASSYTKWFGEYSWRVVVGILFSGEYSTSISNTLMNAISYLVWLFRVRNELMEKRKEKKATTNKPLSWRVSHYDYLIRELEYYIEHLLAKFYGDDGIAAIPLQLERVLFLDADIRNSNDFQTPISGLSSFSDSLILDQDAALKKTDSGEYRHLYTLCDDEDEFVYRGPKILQSHFRAVYDQGENKIVTFRETRYWKVLAPVVDVTNPAIQMMRLVGHAWDTRGNNDQQYQYLLRLYNYTSELLLNKAEVLESCRARFREMLNDPDKSKNIYSDFYDRLRGLFGTDVDAMERYVENPATFPTRETLRCIFNNEDLSFCPVGQTMDWEAMQFRGLN